MTPHMLTNQQIGAALRSTRLALKVKAKDLAALVGISPTVLSKIENGTQQLSFALAIKICDSLGTDLSELAKRAGSTSANTELASVLAEKALLQEQLKALNGRISSFARKNDD